jgi:hypothetical protein
VAGLHEGSAGEAGDADFWVAQPSVAAVLAAVLFWRSPSDGYDGRSRGSAYLRRPDVARPGSGSQQTSEMMPGSRMREQREGGPGHRYAVRPAGQQLGKCVVDGKTRLRENLHAADIPWGAGGSCTPVCVDRIVIQRRPRRAADILVTDSRCVHSLPDEKRKRSDKIGV